MNASNKVSVITPALTKDVTFNDKVEAVDTALKSRAAAQKDIKVKWAAVVKLLQKYELDVPYRRVDPATATLYPRKVRVYLPQVAILEDAEKVIKTEGYHRLDSLREMPDIFKAIEQKFTGFTAWINDLHEQRETYLAPRVLDEAATKAGQTEMEQAVDTYIGALESFDETIESVANVKEYIGIMKDIADISAIAQGIKAKE